MTPRHQNNHRRIFTGKSNNPLDAVCGSTCLHITTGGRQVQLAGGHDHPMQYSGVDGGPVITGCAILLKFAVLKRTQYHHTELGR